MEAVLEPVFEFLFKYRPFVYQRGELALGASWPMLLGLLAVAAAAVPALAYRRAPGALGGRDRVVLICLRLSALAVLLAALLRPMLVVATVVPQQNFLAVVLDDSRSMRIADVDGVSRGRRAADLFASQGGGTLAPALAERFRLRYFRFSRGAERAEGPGALTFDGTGTDLGAGLEYVRRELAAVPLAGIVVVTDGAHNAGNALTESVLRLRADGIPVYPVGVGRERFAQDIAVGRVETPRSVLQGATLVVHLQLSQRGYAGAAVPLQVESNGRIVQVQEIRLPRDGETATVPVRFPAAEPGARLFRFSIPPRPGEQVVENNARDALIVVERQRRKVLYFEGEPRFEVKFVRRAVADDPNLQVVVLQRTAENKFLRLDVDHPEELVAGFPQTREELFAYSGLILGSVAASYFTQDQLRMIADFVGERGGGLLALGGRRAFAEGGYAGTAVADVLPVVLDPSRSDTAPRDVRAVPTPLGLSHPALQIAETIEDSRTRWSALPAVTAVNGVREVKPGASTLLEGETESGESRIVLASQRYGRGRVIALPVQDSWLWQMHADVPLDDRSHETFWQQLLRWLVSGVPDRVTVTPLQDRVGLGEAAALRAEIVDSAFLRVNGAEAHARVLSPSGEERQIPMEWVVDRDGTYHATFSPGEPGLHTVAVEARRGEIMIGEGLGYVYAAEPVDEYFDAELRAVTLRRLADETGGRYYTPEQAGKLVEDVRYTRSGMMVREELDLWDMPAVFLVLVGLVGAEWAYRRARGLA